jgi:hypothetical protein
MISYKNMFTFKNFWLLGGNFSTFKKRKFRIKKYLLIQNLVNVHPDNFENPAVVQNVQNL